MSSSWLYPHEANRPELEMTDAAMSRLEYHPRFLAMYNSFALPDYRDSNRPSWLTLLDGWDISETLAHAVFCGIHDLSSEVQLLCDFPAAVGLNSYIWRGILRNNNSVAVKLFSPGRTTAMQKQLLWDFLREAKVWDRGMDHEMLCLFSELLDSVALISPWMEGGDLSTYLKSRPDANLEELLADVVHGLAHLHSQGIVYGNLRSSTVLVFSTGRAHLSSFLVAHSEEGNDHVTTNTRKWSTVSPEVFGAGNFGASPGRMKTTPKTDVFAFGTTVMEILTDRPTELDNGAYLYRNNTPAELISQDKSPERPTLLRGLTNGLWSIVQSCWQKEPMSRPTMTEVADRMVQLAQACTNPPSLILPGSDGTLRTFKDISADIKKLGEHPIASGGFCDIYLGEDWVPKR